MKRKKMWINFLFDKNDLFLRMTEHLEQIVAAIVVNVTKENHVTRKRGSVLQYVTKGTRDSPATNVRYHIFPYVRYHIFFLILRLFFKNVDKSRYFATMYNAFEKLLQLTYIIMIYQCNKKHI